MQPVAGATSDNLYRYGSGNDWNWTLLQVGLSGTAYTDTGLTNGTTYQYYVCAVDKDGQGYQSDYVSVLPGGPALALAAHVVWTSDYTVSPSTQTASTAGAFGGNATLHLTLTAPQTLWWGAATATVRVHEAAALDGSGDLVWTDVPLYGSPSAACGEPSSSPPPYSTQCYLDLPWNAGGFNGNYVVTATVQATVGGSATPQTVTLDSPLTLDREDLLITGTTPANPTPLKWDPAANNGNPAPLTVSATITAAYKAGGTATLNIYDTQQNLIRTLTQPFTTTDGQVTFSWDGKADGPKDGQGNPVLDTSGNPVPGPMQPKGIYLFQFNVTDTIGCTDSDKSSFLSISAPASDAPLISATDTTATYGVSYTLTSADNPAASAGEIDVYDSTEQIIGSQTLGSLDITPGAHTVTVSAGLPQDYVFLISPTDNAATLDRGHRQRYALQHNNQVHGPPAIYYKKVSFDGATYYVAWCLRGRKVSRKVELQSPPKVLAAYQWARSAASGQMRGAVNGGFFNWIAGDSNYHAYSDIGSGTAGIGAWSHPYNLGELKYRRYCFGMNQITPAGAGGFLIEKMVLLRYTKNRHTVFTYRVTEDIEKKFGFGLSNVPEIVENGTISSEAIPPYGASDYQFRPQKSELRTAIGWSTQGDFFMVAVDGQTWNQVAKFFVNNAGLPSISLPGYTITSNSISAVMLDGSGSTQFGYMNNTVTPPTTDDEGLDNSDRPIPDYIGGVWP